MDIPAFDPRRLGPPAGSRMLVVGGCGGIGLALVRAATEAGIELAVADLQASIDRTTLPAGVIAHAVDATRPDSVAALFEALQARWPHLDVLVNLVGYAHPLMAVSEVEPDTFADVVATSLTSTFLVARLALPMLRRSPIAAGVHMASGLALNPRPGYGAYAAGKAAVIALTKTLARENAPAVRFNTVAPAAVDTAFFSGGTGRTATAAIGLDKDAYALGVPMGRVANPLDVVGPILFLSGPAARYITGQVLFINGGALTP